MTTWTDYDDYDEGEDLDNESCSREELAALVARRARVTVTNPHLGSSWTGRLLAYHEDPGVVIEPDSGPRMCLPASFTITEAPEQVPDEVTVSREDLRAVLRNGVFGPDLVAAADRLAFAVRYTAEEAGQ